jgi:DNA-binding transcriptional regulator LsrR (DeoR family)
MTSFQTAVSPSQRAGARFIGLVRRTLQKALLEEAKRHNLTQAEVARRIGIDRSIVNRELRGVENLTIRRVGELVWAMNRVPEFRALERVLSAGSNQTSVVSSPAASVNLAQTAANSNAVNFAPQQQGAVNG